MIDAAKLKADLERDAADEVHICPWCGDDCDVDGEHGPFCCATHKAMFDLYLDGLGSKP